MTSQTPETQVVTCSNLYYPGQVKTVVRYLEFCVDGLLCFVMHGPSFWYISLCSVCHSFACFVVTWCVFYCCFVVFIKINHYIVTEMFSILFVCVTHYLSSNKVDNYHRFKVIKGRYILRSENSISNIYNT